MFADVLSALRRVRHVQGVAIVTADAVAEAAALADRIEVIPDRYQAGQSTAAMLGIERAQERDYERVLLLPGDAPLLDPGELDALLHPDSARTPEVAIVPDRHGTGTNGLLIAPPGGFRPSFGPDSLSRHIQAAEAAELAHRVVELPSLGHDVDTPEDLAELTAALERRRGLAPRTRGALAQLVRARPPGAPARGALRV